MHSTWCAFRSPLNQVYLFRRFSKVVFEHASWTAFWAHFFKKFFKLKSDFDLLLEASWDPLGTILGDFWHNFVYFLATCLASRFGIDFWCFFDAFKHFFFLILVEAKNAFFTFLPGSMLASILASKTFPKWTQNGPKTVPRGCPRVLKQSSKNTCFLEW